MVANGTQLEIDPGLIPEMDFFEGSTLYVRTDSYYRVNYNYHIYMIKAKEVRIEWL